MKMVFDGFELREIITDHISKNWGVPKARIKGIGFREVVVPNSDNRTLEAEVEIETDRGGPYREPGA